jgi:hypothetical protein
LESAARATISIRESALRADFFPILDDERAFVDVA